MLYEDSDIIPKQRIISLSFFVKFLHLFQYIEYLDSLELNYEYFEKEPNDNIDNQPDDIWQIKIYFDKTTNLIDTEKLILSTFPKIMITQRSLIENKDWVDEVQKNFKPIKVGDIYVHSDFYPKSDLKINIKINPNGAFGTGEHETTKLCLKALQIIFKQNHTFTSCLDLGCGSSILAIAAKKLLPKMKVIASDIDTLSVEVSKSNVKENNIDIPVFLANGFYRQEIRSNAPYSLIVSNILLKPILNLAEQIHENLQAGGFLILSGFIESQQSQIKDKFQSLQFQVVNVLELNNWRCLILKKQA